MAASSSVVIKVKHGDTLRRFTAQILGHNLNLSMDGLRKKIISLFSFDSYSELLLTYIDEDDEVVTLADDDDLRDAVKQALNPLRITVKLKAGKNSPYACPSATSIPLQNPNIIVPEILKSLPGPLYETLAKISASKASSSDSVQQRGTNTGVSQVLKAVAEPLHESLSKVSADLASIAKITADILSKASSPDSFSTEGGIPESNEKLEIIKPEAAVENNEVKTHTVNGGSMDKSSENIVVDNIVVTQPGNDSLPNSGPESAVITSHRSAKRDLWLKKKILMNKKNGKSRLENRPVENNAGKCAVSFNNSGTAKEVNNPRKVDSVDNRTNAALSDGFGNNRGSYWARGLYSGYRPAYDCLFSGLGTGNGSAASARPACNVGTCFTINQNDCSGGIFHPGVRCDSCGVYPIIGPRFKSKVLVDYDLCSICFEKVGNNNDYIRMDRPAVNRHPPMDFSFLQEH